MITLRTLEVIVMLLLFPRILVVSDLCRCENHFTISNETTIRNQSLTGFVSKKCKVYLGLAECFTKCVEEDCACVSFNYQTIPETNGIHICELNFEDKESKGEALQQRIGWEYHRITSLVSSNL